MWTGTCSATAVLMVYSLSPADYDAHRIGTAKQRTSGGRILSVTVAGQANGQSPVQSGRCYNSRTGDVFYGYRQYFSGLFVQRAP